jgi:hypothetical protein
MNSEEDRNEKEKKYDEYLLNWENLRKEFEESKEEEKRNSIASNKKNKKKEKGLPQQMQNSLLYNFINNSHYHNGPLTLLSHKQEFDENESFQKLVDLLYEETQTVPDIQLVDKETDQYFITQLYTTFSLLARKVYLDLPGKEKENEKKREFLQSLNNVNYDKNAILNNQTLHMINHNILRPEEYFQNLKIKEILDEKDREEQMIREKKIEIERLKELKKLREMRREQEKLMAIKIDEGDKFNIEPESKEIKEKKEAFQRDKLSKIVKIIEINDKYFNQMPKKKFDNIMQNIYKGYPLDYEPSIQEIDLSPFNIDKRSKEDYEFLENNCNDFREKFGFLDNENIDFNKINRRQSMNNLKNYDSL